MDCETLVVEERDGWRRVALNRPEKLNSVNALMREELRSVLAQAWDDSAVRALLLTGEGRGFCAGQDLGERGIAPGESPPDLGASLREGYNPLVCLLAGMPKPVVCAVNGVAAGAGANLALACDFVLAARSAKFVQAFAKIGLIPDSGGTWILPRLIGPARARAAAMLGDPVDAQTAERWGMIHACVEDEDLAARSEDLATRLAKAPTAALGRIKQAMLEGETASLNDQLEREADLQRRCGKSADYREGVAAFLEKRRPKFRGE